MTKWLVFIAIAAVSLTLPTLTQLPSSEASHGGLPHPPNDWSAQTHTQSCSFSPSDSTAPSNCGTDVSSGSARPSESGSVIANIPVGCGPYGDTYDSGKQEIFVVNSCGSSVTVISATSNSVVATIPLPAGSNPEGDTYDSRNGYIYTANTGGGTVSVISDATNTVLANIAVPNPVYPWGIDYDSRNGYVYAANDGGGDAVWVISGTSVVTTIGVGSSPDGVTYDGENGNVYTANSGSQTLSVISGATNTVVGTVTVGSSWYPYWVAYGAKSGNIYVASYGTRDIYAISGYTNALVATIPVPSTNIEMSYDSGNNDAYATPCGGNQVYVINGSSNTYLTSITVQNNPCAVVYDTANGDLYVTNAGSNSVSVISTSNPQVTIPVASVSSVDISQSVTFSTLSQGGVPPYTYTWNGLPTGCSSVSATSITCTPTGVGSFLVSVSIRDSTGYSTSSGTLPFTVYSDPSVGPPKPSQPSADANQTLTYNATASGGTTNYTNFAWKESSTNLGCTLANAPSIVCTPVINGTFTTSVTVTDSNGCSSGTPGGCAPVPSTSPPLLVYSDPTVGPPTVSPGAVDVGQWVNLTSSAPVGGLPPYNYTWNGLPSNCVSSGKSKDTCVPQSGGIYNVSVTVTDSNGYSVSSPHVKLVVNNTLTVLLTASARTVDIGQTVTFTAAASFGSKPYVYTWSYSSGMGCLPSSNQTLRCTPTLQGYSTIGITVTDATGKNISNLLVETVNTHPTIYLFGANTTDIKQTLNFAPSASGGTPPYTYQWSAPAALGCKSTTGPKNSCTPLATGVYALSVTLQDSVGVFDTSTLSITVNSPPSVTLSGPTLVDVNQTVRFDAIVGNGSAPYNYIWGTQKSLLCAPSTGPSLSCQPGKPGRYQIGVHLVDAAGLSSTSNFTLQVNADPQVILVGKNVTEVGVSQSYSVRVVGGTNPFSYTWQFPAGLGCGSSNNSTLQCYPTVTGNFTIAVSVVDAAGVSSTTSLLVQVTPVPPILSQPSELSWWIPSLIALLVVILFVIFTARRVRQKRTAQKSEDENPPSPVFSKESAVEPAPTPAAAPPPLDMTSAPPLMGEAPEVVPQEVPMMYPTEEPVSSADVYMPPEAGLPGCPECGSPVYPGEPCPVCGSPTGLPPFPEAQPTEGAAALQEYLDSYRSAPPLPEPPPFSPGVSPPKPSDSALQKCPKCGFPLPGPGEPCSICGLQSAP